LLEEGEDEEFGNAVHEARIGLAGGHGRTIHRGSRYMSRDLREFLG